MKGLPWWILVFLSGHLFFACSGCCNMEDKRESIGGNGQIIYFPTIYNLCNTKETRFLPYRAPSEDFFFLPAHLAGRQIVAGRLTITRPTVKPIGPWQLLWAAFLASTGPEFCVLKNASKCSKILTQTLSRYHALEYSNITFLGSISTNWTSTTVQRETLPGTAPPPHRPMRLLLKFNSLLLLPEPQNPPPPPSPPPRSPPPPQRPPHRGTVCRIWRNRCRTTSKKMHSATWPSGGSSPDASSWCHFDHQECSTPANFYQPHLGRRKRAKNPFLFVFFVCFCICLFVGRFGKLDVREEEPILLPAVPAVPGKQSVEYTFRRAR